MNDDRKVKEIGPDPLHGHPLRDELGTVRQGRASSSWVLVGGSLAGRPWVACADGEAVSHQVMHLMNLPVVGVVPESPASWGVFRRGVRDAELIAAAVGIALDNHEVDGSHHKTWVIDQMLRALLGDRYSVVIAEFCGSGTRYWDEGTTP